MGDTDNSASEAPVKDVLTQASGYSAFQTTVGPTLKVLKAEQPEAFILCTFEENCLCSVIDKLLQEGTLFYLMQTAHSHA